MRADDEMDARIDAALRSYAEPESIPEPRIIAARLLEQVSSQRMRSRWILAWWKPAAAGALALLTMVLLWWVYVPRVQRIAYVPQPPSAVSPASSAGPLHAPPSRSLRASAHRFGAHGRERLPKLRVFPTPRPSSPQELRLAALGSGGEPPVRQQMVAAEQNLDDPIRIAELKIRPLDEDGPPDQPTGKDLP